MTSTRTPRPRWRNFTRGAMYQCDPTWVNVPNASASLIVLPGALRSIHSFCARWHAIPRPFSARRRCRQRTGSRHAVDRRDLVEERRAPRARVRGVVPVVRPRERHRQPVRDVDDLARGDLVVRRARAGVDRRPIRHRGRDQALRVGVAEEHRRPAGVLGLVRPRRRESSRSSRRRPTSAHRSGPSWSLGTGAGRNARRRGSSPPCRSGSRSRPPRPRSASTLHRDDHVLGEQHVRSEVGDHGTVTAALPKTSFGPMPKTSDWW